MISIGRFARSDSGMSTHCWSKRTTRDSSSGRVAVMVVVPIVETRVCDMTTTREGEGEGYEVGRQTNCYDTYEMAEVRS